MKANVERDLSFGASESSGDVSARYMRPQNAKMLYVLAHGAGAGMRHAFMETVSRRLFDRGVATFRYQFPYVEAGRRRPDPPGILTATVRSALSTAAALAPDLPVIAGGKSMGGRMTSQAASKHMLPGVCGLVFLGFPLHPPGKPDVKRADHLRDVDVPMLFLQGTRDSLADLGLLAPVCESLAHSATLHIVDGGDHSFNVLKRSGRAPDEVMDEIAAAIVEWTANLTCASRGN